MKKFTIAFLSERRPKFDRIEHDDEWITYYLGKTVVQRLQSGYFYDFGTELHQTIEEAETLEEAFKKIREYWPNHILQMTGTEIE